MEGVVGEEKDACKQYGSSENTEFLERKYDSPNSERGETKAEMGCNYHTGLLSDTILISEAK